jgi:hypothetical protein
VKTGDLFGYIDHSGMIVIPFQFDVAMPFHGALAPITLHGKPGYIDKRGKVVWQEK